MKTSNDNNSELDGIDKAFICLVLLMAFSGVFLCGHEWAMMMTDSKIRAAKVKVNKCHAILVGDANMRGKND